LINTQGIVMGQFAPRHTHACFCMGGRREHADNSETAEQLQTSFHVSPLGSGKAPPAQKQRNDAQTTRNRVSGKQQEDI
jgi:hypothetical protein